MRWIILIGDDNLDIEVIKHMKHYGENNITDISPTEIIVDYGNEYISYDYDENLINDYEPEELEKIPFPNPHFILMKYSSKMLMKITLCKNNFFKGIYIDDDNGNILPIEEFILKYDWE